VAVTSALAGRGDVRRRWALAVVTVAWAARLERQMLSRVRSSEEEGPRYTEFLEGDRTAAVVGKVFITQGLSQLLVSAPVQLAAASTLPRTGRRWLAAAASGPGAWTVPAPAAMSYLLMFATGAKRTEKRMQDRPGYRDYQERLSFFFPRPPGG
jgi:steroid 5-alpha reductase family enzyme